VSPDYTFPNTTTAPATSKIDTKSTPSGKKTRDLRHPTKLEPSESTGASRKIIEGKRNLLKLRVGNLGNGLS
jgi:hypothetical protein